MDQLETARRALSAPALPGVVGVNQNTVDNALALANRTNHPSFVLTGETDTVEFDLSALELFWQEGARLGPTVAVIARDEDRVPCSQETFVATDPPAFAVRKVNRVEIGAAGVYAVRHPTALGANRTNERQ